MIPNFTLPEEEADIKISRAGLDHRPFPEHTHSYLELVIVTAGTGLHRTGTETYPLRAGDVFVIREGLSHGFESTESLGLINIAFRRRLIEDSGLLEFAGLRALVETEPTLRHSSGFSAQLHLDPHQKEGVVQQAEGMLAESHDQLPGYRLVMQNLLQNLLIRLARYYDNETFFPGKSLSRLTAAAADLEQNFAEELDLKSLARDHGYSPSFFRQEFKRVFGLTPQRYLQRHRIGAAARMLTTGDRRISEIAFACGFNDSNYFSRAFHSQTGLSPREYRCKMRKSR